MFEQTLIVKKTFNQVLNQLQSIPELSMLLKSNTETNTAEIIYLISERYNVEVVYGHLEGSANGFYDIHQRKIKLGNHLFGKELLMVFAHELCHHLQETANRGMLESGFLKDFNTFLQNELEAEKAAYYVCLKYFTSLYEFKETEFNVYSTLLDQYNLESWYTHSKKHYLETKKEEDKERRR